MAEHWSKRMRSTRSVARGQHGEGGLVGPLVLLVLVNSVKFHVAGIAIFYFSIFSKENKYQDF